MVTATELEEYMAEIRKQVCSRCIERPVGGPPCDPLGKQCGIEQHLSELIEVCHKVDSARIDPYIDAFHDEICTNCVNRPTKHCPCALDYLLPLAVEAIETVDVRRAQRAMERWLDT